MGITAVEAPPAPARTLTDEDRQLLARAKELLLRHGWTQGRYQDGGRHCLFAAIFRFDSRSARALINRVEEMSGCSLIWWNDQPGRTFDEVIALLDRLILEG